MKLLLTGAFKYSQEQLNTIRSLGYEITFVKDERVPLDIDVSEFEAVVAIAYFYITILQSLKFKIYTAYQCWFR